MFGYTTDTKAAVYQQCLHAKRQLYRPNLDPLLHHPELDRDMRAQVVDWMRELCHVFSWNNLTFFSSVHVLDLYLSRETIPVEKDNFQLVGVTEMVYYIFLI